MRVECMMNQKRLRLITAEVTHALEQNIFSTRKRLTKTVRANPYALNCGSPMNVPTRYPTLKRALPRINQDPIFRMKVG